MADDYLTLADGRRVHLRAEVPVCEAPDREAWQAKHGVAPYRLENVEPKFLSRAKAAATLDSSAIDFETCNRAKARLYEVELRVAWQHGINDSAVVFYDPSDDSFWAYPDAPTTD